MVKIISFLLSIVLASFSVIANNAMAAALYNTKAALPSPTIKMAYTTLAPFNAIDVQGPFDINVQTNNARQVVGLSGNTNVLVNQVRVTVNNRILYLTAAPDVLPGTRVAITVNLPYLTGLKLAGTAQVNGNIKSCSWLTIYTQDNSSVTLRGEVKLAKILQNGNSTIDAYWTGSDDLRVYSQGCGTIHVAGTTNYLYAYLNGSTVLNARYLRANNVWVRTTGSTFAQVMPLYSLRGFALDNSNIYYYNRPSCWTRFSQDYASVLLVPQ